jgi:2'-5' RNA ligase
MKSLTQVIQSLAQTFDAPVFQPHVTLLGGVEQENTEFLDKLSSLTPFTVNAKGIKSTGAFFQSLYLPIIKNKEMLAARRLAKKAFGVTSNAKFEPHLTLLYANLPEDQKLAAAASIIPNPPTELTFSRLALIKTTGLTNEFKVQKIIDLKQPK